MAKQSILLLTSSFSLSDQGRDAAGVFVADFAKNLSKNSQVYIVAPRSTGSESAPNVVSFWAPKNRPLSTLKPLNPIDLLLIVRVLMSGLLATISAVRKHQVDHVFCFWVIPCGVWARIAKWIYGVPYSTWALGSDIWSYEKFSVTRKLLRYLIRGGQYSYADGYELSERVTKISGRQCRFLSSSRDMAAPESESLPSSQPYHVTFLGRWHPNKGIERLVDSILQLDDEDWCNIASLTIAGGGPDEQLLRDGVAKLTQHSHKINVQGYLSRDEAQKLLLSTDIVLIPSNIESIPVILSDAVSCGCAVVATPVGDLERVVSQHGLGLVAADLQVSSFVAVLKEAIAGSINHYTEKGPDFLERHSLNYSVNQFLIDVGLSLEGREQR